MSGFLPHFRLRIATGHRWLAVGATFLCAITASAQVSLPPNINFYGDEPPRADPAKAVKEYWESMIFRDGRELRGKLVEVTKEEVVWQRGDANTALRFPRGEVRRIVTEAEAQESARVFDLEMQNRLLVPQKKKPAVIPTTLKLPGGDWLFGNVTSTDGQTFSLQLEDGTAVAIARPQIEWIQFGATPVPAFGFSGNALDMEAWSPACARMEQVGHTLSVTGATWISRQISPPKKFEVAFELPEDSEDGTQFWLQQNEPVPFFTGSDLVKLHFSKERIYCLLGLDQPDSGEKPLPKAAQQDKGPAKFRVFYDGGQKRVLVQRNGRFVGEWKFSERKNQQPGDAAAREIQFTNICFNRHDDNQPKNLRLNRLRIQPWDGVLPKEGEPDGEQDRLIVGEAASFEGKLEAVSEKELKFSGTTQPRQEGSFVRFSGSAASGLAQPESRIDLGQQGEFNTRHLEIHDGRIRCETAFAGTLEFPLSALRKLTFQTLPPLAPTPVDVLVFKNSDELPGKALSATLEGPVRWKTMQGQELEFQPGRIAGIRFASAAVATDSQAPEPATALLELRSGEMLRGKLMSLDEKQVHLVHAQLGSIAVDRSRLWHLFSNPQFQGTAGGHAPQGWTLIAPSIPKPGKEDNTTSSEGQHCLDGTYLLRCSTSQPAEGSFLLPGMQLEVDPALEQFEVRLEAAQYSDLLSAAFLLSICSKESTSLYAMFCNGRVELDVINPRTPRQRPRRIVPLRDNPGNSNVRQALRIFVNTRTGTCDIVVNGVLIRRLGQIDTERLLKSHYTVKIQPYPNPGVPAVFSNLWVGPWSGELPQQEKAAKGAITLANGDFIPGLPKSIREEKAVIESELGGKLELPLDKIVSAEFGGTMEREHAAARICLADGTTVNLDAFHWDGHELTAHSPIWGDLRLPPDAVRELIYHPVLLRPPAAVAAEQVTEKESGQDAPVEQRR